MPKAKNASHRFGLRKKAKPWEKSHVRKSVSDRARENSWKSYVLSHRRTIKS